MNAYMRTPVLNHKLTASQFHNAAKNLAVLDGRKR